MEVTEAAVWIDRIQAVCAQTQAEFDRLDEAFGNEWARLRATVRPSDPVVADFAARFRVELWRVREEFSARMERLGSNPAGRGTG